jgi:DNA-binding FadR family transcriptional regulator
MPGGPGEKRAVSARIAARIREEITAGVWRLGQRLPPEFELAAAYGVSRGTVVRALELLRGEGLVMTVHGQGSQVAAIPELAIVVLGPGDSAAARMPDDHERDAPLMVVTRRGGAAPGLYDAAVTVIRGA